LFQGRCQVAFVSWSANVQVDESEGVQLGIRYSLKDRTEEWAWGTGLGSKGEVGKCGEAELEEEAVETRVVDEVKAGEAWKRDKGGRVGNEAGGEGGESVRNEGLETEVFDVWVGAQEGEEGREGSGGGVEGAVDEAELAQTNERRNGIGQHALKIGAAQGGGVAGGERAKAAGGVEMEDELVEERGAGSAYIVCDELGGFAAGAAKLEADKACGLGKEDLETAVKRGLPVCARGRAGLERDKLLERGLEHGRPVACDWVGAGTAEQVACFSEALENGGEFTLGVIGAARGGVLCREQPELDVERATGRAGYICAGNVIWAGVALGDDDTLPQLGAGVDNVTK
jgi:hypothetical protein